MADLTPIERIQPCLLDRLTDEQPDRKRESRSRRVISLKKFKEGVLRDLNWLFNSSTHLEEEGLSKFPQVERSVFNFGVPSLSGRTGGNMDLRKLETQIYDALVLFEPRIIKNTLSIKIIVDQSRHWVLRFEIHGELWAQPLPEQFFAKTEVDLETGRYILQS